jgi:hypothetical protein
MQTEPTHIFRFACDGSDALTGHCVFVVHSTQRPFAHWGVSGTQDAQSELLVQAVQSPVVAPGGITQVGMVVPEQSVSDVHVGTHALSTQARPSGQSLDAAHWMQRWWAGFDVSQRVPVPACTQSLSAEHAEQLPPTQ